MTLEPGCNVLSVGRVYCDLVFAQIPKMPVLGEEVYAQDFSAHAGGGAFITASHFRFIGMNAALCAVLPSGAFGELLNDPFANSGVDLSPSVKADESWGHQLTVAMAHDDDRAFLTKRGGDAVPHNCEAIIRSGQYQHLHIAELATLLECPQLIGWARAANMSISLDCSWDVDAMNHRDALGLIAQCDVFLPNLAEFQFVMKGKYEGEPDIISQKFGACSVVVKCGADGAIQFSNGDRLNVPSTPATVVDATGAGDAFNAGYLAAWLRNDDAELCLRAGHAQALMAISQVGGALNIAQSNDHFDLKAQAN
ncbi:carbohydrate kinase family protein [Maritalea sp.]|uniref:carbohydrate kinase family protein n=1 Tax=Maritalea sp. TaxID=2003361 RepID=UPI003EF1D9D6